MRSTLSRGWVSNFPFCFAVIALTGVLVVALGVIIGDFRAGSSESLGPGFLTLVLGGLLFGLEAIRLAVVSSRRGDAREWAAGYAGIALGVVVSSFAYGSAALMVCAGGDALTLANRYCGVDVISESGFVFSRAIVQAGGWLGFVVFLIAGLARALRPPPLYARSEAPTAL